MHGVTNVEASVVKSIVLYGVCRVRAYRILRERRAQVDQLLRLRLIHAQSKPPQRQRAAGRVVGLDVTLGRSDEVVVASRGTT